jgi:hypothetical protein
MERNTPYDTGKVKIGLPIPNLPLNLRLSPTGYRAYCLATSRGWMTYYSPQIQSIGLIAFIAIVMLLTGGTSNA